jgi:lipoprotein NlpD
MLARMNRHLISLTMGAAVLALAACSTVVVEPPGAGAGHAAPLSAPTPGGSYVVAKGDTLYAIAFRKGVDYRDLAKWNGIAAPYTIWPGQRLQLSAVGGSTAAPVVAGTVAPVRPAPPAPSARAPAPPAASPMFEDVPATPAPASAPATAAAASHASAPAAGAPAHVPAVASAAKPAVPAVSAGVEVPVAGVPKAAVPPPAPAVTGGSAHAAGGVTWRWPADGQILKRFTPGDAVPGIEIAGKEGDPVRAAADGVVVYSGNGLVGYGELVIIKHNDSLLSAYGHNSKRLVKEGQRVSAGQEIAMMGSSGASRVELGFQIRKDGNPVDPMSYLPAKQ